VSNTLITPSVIAKEALLSFENEMVFGGLVHRDYKKEFVKIGSKVSIRKPVKFVASDGNTRVHQNVSESVTDITINKRKHVSWAFSMQDLTLTVSEYNKRYIQPACAALANIVDSDLASLHDQLFMFTGTPGTTPSAFSDIIAPAQKADEQLWPKKDRNLVLNPTAYWKMADAFDTSVFSTKITEAAIERGALGKIAGLTIWQDANIKTFTPGTQDTSTPVVNGTQTGSSILCAAGDSASTYLKGDIVTFATTYDVNPMSGDAYPNLKQFVVTEDEAVAGDGSFTLEIYPPIITSGAYKTCSVGAVTGQAVVRPATCTTKQVRNMLFHKNALALVMVPLELPQGAAFKARETYKNLSITVVKDFDIDEYEDIIRLDIMYGVKAIYPELGCIVCG
jgi:hypothetical protein